MARGKYLSLEEARKAGTIEQFCKEHPSQADERYAPLLDAMTRGLLEGGQTSVRAVSEGYSGTRTLLDKKGDTSG